MVYGSFGLTTAYIFYWMPDYRHVLQEHIWQFDDEYPKFPRLKRFLDFWDKEIEGPIHRVYVAHKSLYTPSELRHVDYLA